MSQTPHNPRRLLGVSLLAGGVGALVWLAAQQARTDRRLHARLKAQETAEPARMKSPRPGDILLFHHARGENLAITMFTHSPIYHVGIYAGAGQVVEARLPGVMRGSLHGREKHYVVLPAPGGKGQGALAWAKSQIGDGYDDMDILVIILDRIFRRLRLNYTAPNKYTCGEFVARAYEQAGLRLFPDRELADVVPGDFERLLPSSARPTS